MTPVAHDEFREFIDSHREFLILSHVDPDGDAIGSALGAKSEHSKTAEATLTPTGKAADQFTLSAWHTYADPGSYPIMVRVTANGKTGPNGLALQSLKCNLYWPLTRPGTR